MFGGSGIDFYNLPVFVWAFFHDCFLVSSFATGISRKDYNVVV